MPNGASLSNPYNNYVGGAPFPYNGSYANGGGILGVAQDFEWARAYQTNVGVQRQIGKSLALGAAYVGTFTRNLPFQRDVNYPVATPTASTAGANILSRRPNPVFGTVLMLDSDQYSNYNGLQITFMQRPWRRISFNGFYTLSKTMGSVQLHNNTTAGGAQNYSKLDLDYGRADTDQRHVFSMSVNWTIDYYRGSNGALKHILNGWSLAPIIKLRSGLPFTITNGNVDANLDGNTNDRAQLTGEIRTSTIRRRRSGSIPPRSSRTGSWSVRRWTATRRATCSTVPDSASSISRSRATSVCPAGPG